MVGDVWNQLEVQEKTEDSLDTNRLLICQGNIEDSNTPYDCPQPSCFF